MKLNTLFFAAVCAGTLFNSCVNETAKENQLKYTHTTLVDGDAYSIFHKVGETVQVGAVTAEQMEATGEAKSKEVASQVKAYYAQLLPALDSLATSVQIDFPIKGIPTAGEQATASVDSVVAVPTTHAHVDYVHQAQHEIALVKEQLTRLSRNTNKDLQKFAKKQLDIVSELYTQIGGKEEGHAHH